jgi:serine/threonine-protein kinase
MATVYLARDVRHDRRVAVKVLSPELGALLGADRFITEIKVTANLQHPNLVPLFDSGEADGQLYYVMPFVEGESLRSRLDRERQLSVDEAVRIATDVAKAMDYAHRHGVIHRDLKPENILLHEGQALVADFGIALAVTNAAGARITQSGMSIGTPQYMSPEQAAGDRALDGRTDIYALGTVLYEMLTGDPPHVASTAQATVAKVLVETPHPVRSTRPSVPAHVDAAIARALEKVPADRFATAQEMADALTGKSGVAAASVTPDGRTPRPASRRPKKLGVKDAIYGTLLFGVAVAVWATRMQRRSDAPLSFFLTPTGNEDINRASVAVSRDGLRIAYVASDSGKARIYVRTMSEPAARALIGTDGAQLPTFSPDGTSLAYFADGSLQLVSVDGGASRRVVSGLRSFQWSFRWIEPDRIIIPSADLTAQRSGLSEVTLSTGRVRTVIAADSAHGENLQSPFVVPNHKDVLMVSAGPGGLEDDFLAFGSLDGGPPVVTRVLVARMLGMYQDLAIYEQQSGLTLSTISAVHIDLKHHRTLGSPLALLEGVGNVALSDEGTLVYTAGRAPAEVAWIDATGAQTVVLPATSARATPRLSPDNSSLAFVSPGNPSLEVWTYNLASQQLAKLTTGGGANPEWTPDGKSILYVVPTTARAGLWLARVDGSTPSVRLRPLVGGKPAYILSAVVAPDGRTLMFTTRDSAGHNGAHYYVPSSGNDSAVAWNPGSNVLEPRFSPNQNWVAYTSVESGVPEVFVRAFPGPGPRVQISTGGGDKPIWSPDGTTIYYRHRANIVAAKIATQPNVVVQSRRDEFPIPGTCLGSMPYDISRNGKRLICARADDLAVKTVVTTHWFDEVRKRLQ